MLEWGEQICSLDTWLNSESMVVVGKRPAASQSKVGRFAKRQKNAQGTPSSGSGHQELPPPPPPQVKTPLQLAHIELTKYNRKLAVILQDMLKTKTQMKTTDVTRKLMKKMSEYYKNGEVIRKEMSLLSAQGELTTLR